MARQADPDAEDAEGPGGEFARLRAAILTGVLLGLAAVVVLYALVVVWPPAPAPPITGPVPGATTTTAPTAGAPTTATTIAVQSAPNPPVRFFGGSFTIEREARLFVVVALSGALGGLVYALRSLAWYAGNRNLKYSWLLTYALQPVVGAALATITYVVARGGLIVVTTQSSSDVVNPFGFAAIAGLVGLFTSQAAEWLKRIFEQIFTPAMKGKDAAVEITSISPNQGQPERTTVTIRGTGFVDVLSVSFGGGVEATNVTRVSDTEIRVTVPKDAKDGPITVKTSAGTATSRESFKILAGEDGENAERRV